MSVSELSKKFMEFYDKLSSWEHSVVKDSGLSPAQMHTIEVIGHHQDLMMRELEDRRPWMIVPTDQGKSMYEEQNRCHE